LLPQLRFSLQDQFVKFIQLDCQERPDAQFDCHIRIICLDTKAVAERTVVVSDSTVELVVEEKHSGLVPEFAWLDMAFHFEA
jgi:hypothetical protein